MDAASLEYENFIVLKIKPGKGLLTTAESAGCGSLGDTRRAGARNFFTAPYRGKPGVHQGHQPYAKRPFHCPLLDRTVLGSGARTDSCLRKGVLAQHGRRAFLTPDQLSARPAVAVGPDETQ